jgi:hypothetical protein
VIGDHAVLIAQHLRDKAITFTSPPPIADQVRERLKLAFEGFTRR